MKCPTEIYQSSPRPYTGLPDVDYPFHDKTIVVTRCGRICLGNKKINFSQVFAGQAVGIKEVHDDIWLVSFMDYDLGYFDLETRVLEPLENPLRPKSVTYVLGTICEFVGTSREIAPGINLIVTRSVMMGDFSAYPPNEPGHPDLEGFPELSLALKTGKGVVLITGCSHSKVEEIIRATKQFIANPIELVEGGFHLFPYDSNYISKLAWQMKDELGVRRVAPAHCTGNLAFKIFRDVYGENYNYAGVESEVMFPH